MRVIAGLAKGRNLKCLKGNTIRPTLDRVKESVFNVLGALIREAVFLDIFAGTGAMGIEALSRGASFCCFNDIQRKSCDIIRANIQNCQLEEKSRVFNMEALRLIEHLDREELFKFDIVYLDPPYAKGLYLKVLTALAQSALLKKETVVIAESDSKEILPEKIGGLTAVRNKVYGDTRIWFYQMIHD